VLPDVSAAVALALAGGVTTRLGLPLEVVIAGAHPATSSATSAKVGSDRMRAPSSAMTWPWLDPVTQR
jgi:hypothetical protein